MFVNNEMSDSDFWSLYDKLSISRIFVLSSSLLTDKFLSEESNLFNDSSKSTLNLTISSSILLLSSSLLPLSSSFLPSSSLLSSSSFLLLLSSSSLLLSSSSSFLLSSSSLLLPSSSLFIFSSSFSIQSSSIFFSASLRYSSCSSLNLSFMISIFSSLLSKFEFSFNSSKQSNAPSSNTWPDGRLEGGGRKEDGRKEG